MPPPRKVEQMKQGKKSGFTLSEVLITLGIIGVVAAITLPNIITNLQKKVTVTRLKHAYSVLHQAVEQSETVNGEITNWDFEDKWFEKYMMPHIKGIKKQKFSKNGTLGITYKELSGKPETGLALMRGLYENTNIYTLANGTQIITQDKSSGAVVDINGYAKPNQFGRDLFYFYISKKYKVYPSGLHSTSECTFPNEPNTDRNILKNNTGCTFYRYGCNKNGRGIYCGALIMVDGWKIAPDYPW